MNPNPLQMMMMLKQGNAQSVVEQIIQSNYSNNPEINSLFQMARQGNTQELYQYAQQLFAQNGRDFNSEYNNFLKAIKLL